MRRKGLGVLRRALARGSSPAARGKQRVFPPQRRTQPLQKQPSIISVFERRAEMADCFAD